MPQLGWLQDIAKGVWWLPDQPDTHVPGVLIERDGQFRLELIGEFPESHRTMHAKRYPVVLGHLAEGGSATLLSCVGTKSLSVPGMFTERCSFGTAIKGHHFVEGDGEFTSLTGHFSSLLAWLNRSGLEVTLRMPTESSKDGAFEWSAIYRLPAPIPLQWNDEISITVRIGVEGLSLGTHANKTTSIRQSCYAEARSARPTTIAHLHEALYGFDLLVRLFSGFPSQVTLTNCESPRACMEDGRQHQLKLQFDRVAESNVAEVEVLDWRNALVPYSSIEQRLTNLVVDWQVLLGQQGEVIDAYFAGKRARHMEEQLVASANALQRLVESKNGRQSFESAISGPIRTYVEPTVADTAILLLTKTRHYWTHFNPSERNDAARGAQLANLVDLADAVVTCKLLELLSFEVEEIKEFFANSLGFNKHLKMNRWLDR